jgi:hypothetical protein
MTRPGIGQWIAGAGGVVLIVALFLPWVEVEGASRSGWELSTMADVFFLIAGLVAVGALITGGRLGFFRPDVSVNGAADMLGVVASVMLAWLLIFDLPDGAGAEAGLFLALLGAVAIMGGAGDYSMFRRSSTTASAPKPTGQANLDRSG